MNEFLELRCVRGKSFDAITNEHGVSKQTFINWSVRYRADLQNIIAAKLYSFPISHCYSIKYDYWVNFTFMINIYQ